MNAALKAKIEKFFEDPKTLHDKPRCYGVLHLLRRDILRCFGKNPENGKPIQLKDPESGKPIDMMAMWPGTMAILAGMDLLGKFLSGDDDLKCSGIRFKYFAATYFKIAAADAETIYKLRNCLMHSFGLTSKNKKGEIDYMFALQANQAPLIRFQGEKRCLVDLITLNDKFEEAIKEYKNHLMKCKVLQDNFEKMYSDYGKISIK